MNTIMVRMTRVNLRNTVPAMPINKIKYPFKVGTLASSSCTEQFLG